MELKKKIIMKKYQLILMVVLLFFTACSQKEESPKVIQKDKDINVSKEKIVIKKEQTLAILTPPLVETISITYIESVEAELKKIEENTPTIQPLVSNYEEENYEEENLLPVPVSVPIPDHIKNSTIQSVPR